MDATIKQQIALAGFGVEGQAAYRYFAGPTTEITIFDESHPASVPDGARVVTGKEPFEHLDDYDIIVRSPSIRPDRIKTKGTVTSVTKEFFKKCPAMIIGVTATKGKGTISTMIHDILARAGHTVHLVGNIGQPALDVLPQIHPEDIVVYELSSFQLWDMTQSPHIAVIGMLEPEHLDVHKDAAEYFAVKGNIANFQTQHDQLVFLSGNADTEALATLGEGTKTPYTKRPGAYVEHGYIVIDDQKICRIEDIGVVGPHNVDNACAAVTAAWHLTQDVPAIAEALKQFAGLEHRLKFVAEVKKVSYYDDSIATTPGSVMAALNSFRQPKILIMGGSDKGVDFAGLAQAIREHNVKKVISIGKMRTKIADELTWAGYPTDQIELFDEKSTMSQIVVAAQKAAKPGDVVILSPACASYDMFKNYKDRGQQFIAAVKSL
jgi:UDP-N-acetylmuramoylalanine--D-glutamate ligase